jgi:DNA-binding NarL/FixJ family response regulator
MARREESRMARVLIADDHPLFRDAIRGVVAQVFADSGWEFSCVEAATVGEVMRIAESEDELDVLLLDLYMPGAHGLSQLVALRSKLPSTPIIVLSSISDPETVQQCITCGAAGFVPKSSSKELIAIALKTVFDGGVYIPQSIAPSQEVAPLQPVIRRHAGDEDNGPLTGRQVAVLELVASGKSNKQIAWELSISETTVKAHMTAILRKLGVTSRAQAIVLFQRQLLPPSLPN